MKNIIAAMLLMGLSMFAMGMFAGVRIFNKRYDELAELFSKQNAEWAELCEKQTETWNEFCAKLLMENKALKEQLSSKEGEHESERISGTD